ncbi:hypothetical protein BH11PAT3_BH11PAT3_2050 [soil metagenome]
MNWEKRFTNFIGSKPSVLIHTVFFIFMLILPFLGVKFDTVLLVLTTLVSLEAIYLSIFIQMSVNQNTASLHEVEENIDEIQEDVDEIQHDVDEIQQDVDEISTDIDEIQEDVDEIQEEDDLENIKKTLNKLLKEVDALKPVRKSRVTK